MIKQIIKIKNVGKFESYSSSRDVDFRKMNIIYSENGQGKTTLSAILRSLRKGEDDLIMGRKRLGASADPEVQINFEGNGNISFNNKRWDKQYENLEIFDSQFVSENICSGYYVDHEQKKQLYLFTVGEQGVELSNNLLDIDDKIRKNNKDIKEAEQKINSQTEGEISTENFLKLGKIDNITESVKLQQQEVDSISKSKEIQEKNLMSKLIIPIFNHGEFDSLLSASIENIHSSAEQLTKDHIAKYFEPKGEAWLEYGVSRIQDDLCPFCEQDIKSVELISAYKGFFSQEYSELKKRIESYISDVKSQFSQKILLGIQGTLTMNSQLIQYWAVYIPIEVDSIALIFDDIQMKWEEFIETVLTKIDSKKNKPLEMIESTEEEKQVLENYQELIATIEGYNQQIDELNKRINIKKQSLENSDIEKACSKLNDYKNIALRHSEEMGTLCTEYTSLQSRKITLNSDKKKLKATLESYTRRILKSYQDGINAYLEKFGAGFKIIDQKDSFLGGKPSVDYRISINNVPVKLGNADSLQSEPSFKNTLSEGDKSTLAFAFFMAKLDQDSNISHKTIVFDDPISSLDIHRKSRTVQNVVGLGNKAKQVIVLTHDLLFSRELWGSMDKRELRTLCIIRSSAGNKLSQWDIERETQGQYFQNYNKLVEFLEGNYLGDLRDVARCIRPLLEGNLRLRFPKEFKDATMLGQAISKIRETDDVNSELYRIKNQIVELEEINDYSKKYHHDQNPGAADHEPISDTELQSYVEQTLRIIGGIFEDKPMPQVTI